MVASYSFALDLPTIVVFVCVITALLLQLWLCCKAKRIFIKLIPVATLALLTIAFLVGTVCASGWDAFGYLFFARLSFGLIVVCGIGWGIWAIIRKKDK